MATGLVSGQSPGSTLIDASDASEPLYSHVCYGGTVDCPMNTGIANQAQGNTNPRPAQLIVVSDCYWPNGAQYTIGYTRVITYQVLGPSPANQVFYGSAVPTVQETVTTIQGPPIVGNGVWSPSAVPPTIDSSGRFNDFLSANGNSNSSTAHQSFTATDSTGTVNIYVNIGGAQYGTLSNTYSTTTVTVAQTVSPRQCQSGDPF